MEKRQRAKNSGKLMDFFPAENKINVSFGGDFEYFENEIVM